MGDNINCGYRYNISVNDGYREDPNGTSWDKKGKIFWISNFCGQNPVRCPNIGTFIYNNTIFVSDTLNPEIYFWPNIGDVHVYNNLIVVGKNGQSIPTLIENNLNVLNISHNLFYDSSRISLDSDLQNNALYGDPLLFNTNNFGEDNPQAYQIQNNSPAIGSGFLINGSSDTNNYLEHNGGLDYFGNSVSHLYPSNIGAFNGTGPVNILSINLDEIKIYPSITHDYVNISTNEFVESIKTNIYALNGNFLETQIGKKLSFKKFKSGIYSCVIIFGNKKTTIKIVKL